MRKLIFLSVLFMFGCSDSNNETQQSVSEVKEPIEMLEDKILALETRVYDETSENIMSDMNELMLTYQDFGNKYGDHDNAAESYFKAAELAYALSKFNHSLDLHKKVIGSYPDFDKKKTSMFMIAMIYHYQLKDKDAAIKYYENIIEMFPDTQEAMDAAASIPLVGLTDEEIIEKFEKQNAPS